MPRSAIAKGIQTGAVPVSLIIGIDGFLRGLEIVTDSGHVVERPFMAGCRLTQLAYTASAFPTCDRRHATQMSQSVELLRQSVYLPN